MTAASNAWPSLNSAEGIPQIGSFDSIWSSRVDPAGGFAPLDTSPYDIGKSYTALPRVNTQVGPSLETILGPGLNRSISDIMGWPKPAEPENKLDALSSSINQYFMRAVVVILGFIFIAAGLYMAATGATAVQTVKAVVR